MAGLRPQSSNNRVILVMFSIPPAYRICPTQDLMALWEFKGLIQNGRGVPLWSPSTGQAQATAPTPRNPQDPI